MSPQETVAESKLARKVPGSRWPATLIAYLVMTLDENRAIDWVISCVKELLNTYGKATDELTESISMARNYALEGGNVELIERRAQSLWRRRSAEGDQITAVAQLLFAFSRSNGAGKEFCASSLATPICLLERLERQPDEAFDRVIKHFLSFVDSTPDE